MCKWLRVAILTSTLFCVPMQCCRLLRAQASDLTQTGSSENRETLTAWLKSAGLANQLEIIRIGPGPHPDPDFALDADIQHLELGFATKRSSQVEEVARFQQLLNSYQQDHAIALTEKLFYEFTRIFAINREDACVDLHVSGLIYSVYSSRNDGSLVVLNEGKRDHTEVFSVTIPSVAPQEQFHARLGKPSAPDPKLVRDAVEKSLRNYIESLPGSGNSKPVIDPDVRKQDGYLHLLVHGGRGMVTDGYWEWLDIGIVFYPDQASARGTDSLWNFVCNVDVRYASSPRETRLTDADSDYAAQVAHFRVKLVQQLQANMEKGIHD